MKLRVTVNGVSYNVEVDILEDGGTGAAPAPVAPRPAPAAVSAPPRPAPSAPPPAAGGANSLNSPIPGTVVEIKVAVGQTVALNETLLIIDAMKMNTPVAATRAGTVARILVAPGDAVRTGQPLIEFS